MKRLRCTVAAVAAMSMLFSCERERFFESDSNLLGVEVSESTSLDEVTKTSDSGEFEGQGDPYLFEVNGEELSLTESVSRMSVETPASAMTKGTPITAVGDSFDEFTLHIRTAGNKAYTYQYGSQNYDGTPQAVNYTAADDKWDIASKVYWPEKRSLKLQFFATNSLNAGASQTVTETFKSINVMHIVYSDAGSTSNAAATGEADLLYAYTKTSSYKAIQRAEDVAIGLHFHHALAGIKFNFGTITSGLKLTNVTLGGIATSGECDYTDAESGDSPTFNWTPGSAAVSLSQSFNTLTTSSSAGATCDDSGSLSKTFFIVPQDITADATVTFTFEYSLDAFSADSIKHEDYGSASKMTFTTKPIKFSALSSTGKWSAGSLYTYTVSGSLVFAELGMTMSAAATAAGSSDPTTEVKKITFSVGEIPDTKAPLVTGAEVQSSRSLTKIYATLDSGTLTLHTTAPKIYMRPYSGNLFSDLTRLVEVEGMKYIDTRNVTSMFAMFHNCNSLTGIDVSNFDTSNVTDMHELFNRCNSLRSIDVTNFDTSNVTDMHSMFYNCYSLSSLDVTNFDTSKVTDMESMFWNCSGLTSLDVTKFNTSNVTTMQYMFEDCSGLTSLDVTKFDTSKVTDMSYMFWDCSGLTSLDVTKFNTSKVTDMSYMFRGCSGLTSLDATNFDTSNVTTMEYMFSECGGLTSLNVKNFDASDVTTMAFMFWRCRGLTSLDLSNFNTSKVTDMSNMFMECSALTSIDLSSFDTSKVTDMSGMFMDCSSLTSLNVSNFDTSNLTTIGSMFSGCSSLTSLDLSNFNTSKITNMTGMFSECSSLTSLDVTSFDTSKVYSLRLMFNECSSLTSLDVKNFNTSNVVDMYSVFNECSSLTSLDLSNFDTGKAKTMDYMFNACRKMSSLKLGSSFTVSSSKSYLLTDFAVSVTGNAVIYCTSGAQSALSSGTGIDTSKVTFSII